MAYAYWGMPLPAGYSLERDPLGLLWWSCMPPSVERQLDAMIRANKPS